MKCTALTSSLLLIPILGVGLYASAHAGPDDPSSPTAKEVQTGQKATDEPKDEPLPPVELSLSDARNKGLLPEKASFPDNTRFRVLIVPIPANEGDVEPAGLLDWDETKYIDAVVDETKIPTGVLPTWKSLAAPAKADLLSNITPVVEGGDYKFDIAKMKPATKDWWMTLTPTQQSEFRSYVTPDATKGTLRFDPSRMDTDSRTAWNTLPADDRASFDGSIYKTPFRFAQTIDPDIDSSQLAIAKALTPAVRSGDRLFLDNIRSKQFPGLVSLPATPTSESFIIEGIQTKPSGANEFVFSPPPSLRLLWNKLEPGEQRSFIERLRKGTADNQIPGGPETISASAQLFAAQYAGLVSAPAGGGGGGAPAFFAGGNVRALDDACSIMRSTLKRLNPTYEQKLDKIEDYYKCDSQYKKAAVRAALIELALQGGKRGKK